MSDPSPTSVRVFALLEECVGLPPPERETFVEMLARREPEVAADLSRLLARDATGDGFLEEAVCDLLTKPPARVGPYRLGAQLGEGGNGVVFRAERVEGQPSYPVAVKILWRGTGDGDASRVAEELEHLGALEHPGICRMLETGTTENGAPWFAMELVEGLPIDRYCIEGALPLRARLELFLEVLEAVEYAHSKQLLHRDLKPSNILVDVHGRPRLLDFGIAGRLEAGTTGSGVGSCTPGYASPEQLRGERLGPASDVFTLGALLYHLVCDRPAFAYRGGDREEVARRVGAGPVPPSEILARSPGPILPRQVRGRLEAILAKAMAPRPRDRYLSVSRLAEDLDRYLCHRPVQARSARVGERLVLALRRHRLAWAAAALLALSSAAIGWQALRIDAARGHAEAAARRAETTSRLLLDSLADLDPATRVVGELKARELIERAKRRIEGRDLEPELRAELLLAIGSLFAGVGAYEPAAEALEEARELRPRDPRVLESLALAKVRVAAYDEAEQLARRALSMREAEGPDEDRFTPLTTLAFTVLRNSRNEQERLEEAERLVARAVELAVAQRLPEIELGRAERLQASVLLQLGRTEEALEVAQRALDRLERSRAPAYELALAENNLALAEEGLGRTGAAIERLRSVASSLERVLGPEHPEVAGALHNVGNALAEDRRFGEAEDVFEVALERYERLLGAEHPMTLNCASSAAYALQESGELERAEVLHRRVASGLESALGGDHRFVPLAWAYVAENLALQGRAEEALRALERAAPAASGDEDWISLVAASISAFVTGQEGASPALEEELERTRRLLEERFGPHSRHARAAADRLARYRSRSAA